MDTAVNHTPGKSKFMNARAEGNQAYVPTNMEHIANVITHALWVIPSFIGWFLLVQRSTSRSQYVSCFVYGSALVALFLVSTIFHSVFYMGRFRFLKETLHLCDRAVIYVFIAASYTPWSQMSPNFSSHRHDVFDGRSAYLKPMLLLKKADENFWTQNIGWLVWIMAVIGILYQYNFHERYKTLETLFYMVIGVTPSIAMFYMHEPSGLKELAFGGLVYIAGIVFFKCDGRIPCAHAIWHMFVNIGATFHFYAVYKYLMTSSADATDKKP